MADPGLGVRKAKRVMLQPGTSVAAAAAAAVTEAHAHFDANAQLLERGSHDPEAVHQARVALRKLRVFTRLFEEQIGRDRAGALQDALRYLFRQLGKVRDLQVLLDDARPGGRAKGARTTLRRTLRARQDALERIFRSLRYRKLRAALAELDAALAAAEAQSRRPSAKPFFARALERLWRRARRLGKQLADDDLASQHRLRKRLKRLRYVAELAPELFPKHPGRARAFIRKLSRLQDTLGELVDLHAGGLVLGRLHAPSTVRARFTAEAEGQRVRLLAELHERLADLAASPRFWRA
jgi:triphosphatase